MKIDRRFLPHVLIGAAILLCVIVVTLLYQKSIKVPNQIAVKEELIVDNSDEQDIFYEQTEKQIHKEMTLQDILTKATKRIVIDQEKKDDTSTE